VEEICRSDFASLSANGSCIKRFTDGDQWWAQPAEPGMHRTSEYSPSPGITGPR